MLPIIVAGLAWLAQADNPQKRYDDAADMARSGQYERAADVLLALTEPPQLVASATILAADCLVSVGRVDRALVVLTERPANTAVWNRAIADVFSAVGNYGSAIRHASEAVTLDANFAPGRFQLGRLYELTGDLDKARTVYAPFDAAFHRAVPEDPEELHYAGLGFYRYSVLSQVSNLAERTRYVLQEVLQPACMILDLTYWPARLSIGDLLREKYSLEEALEDYRAVLLLNPHSVGAHLGIARIALQSWDFENTERRIEVCLDINPHSADAYGVLAALRMLERRFADARRAAEAGLAINPNHLECLALLASAHLRLGQRVDADATLEHIHSVSPRPALAHAIIGKQLSDARQFAGSEDHLLKAIEQDPSDPAPRNELAMMYMQWGREADARRTADAAFEIDRFNAQTKHTLDLLEVIEGFETHLTEHFEIHFDGTQDKVIGPYMGDYLESIYDELTEDYEVELPERTIIEVFPDHRQFGVRIHGKPWIHTIGACTGRVIAMDAPRHGVAGPYHYAHVLRHEFTHTVTLAATENRIPHWFTEGLAVLQEDRPRSWQWMVMLSKRLSRNTLFSLSEIDWGFIRPRRHDDRQVAYAQSEWMCEFIIERFGYDIINDMLVGYRQGETLETVLAKTIGMTPAVFDTTFVAWARDQAATWGLSLERPIDGVAAQVLRYIYPRSPRLAAELSRLARENDDPGKALDIAQEAVAENPHDPAALQAAARAHLVAASHAPSEALQRSHIDAAHEAYVLLVDHQSDNAEAAEFLAEWAQEHDDRPAAQHWARRLKILQPSNPTAHRILSWAALEEQRDDEALPHLLALALQDEHDPDIPRQIARIYRQRERLRESGAWYRTALWIDPYEPDIHRDYGQLLTQLNDAEGAIREYRMLTLLAPGEARGHADLAFALHAAGRRDEAARAAEQAVRIDPNSPARQFLETGD